MATMTLAMGASAGNLGPCNDGVTGSGGTPPAVDFSGANYAAHHIVPLAKGGNLGNPNSGAGHRPGTHQGFSTCL